MPEDNKKPILIAMDEYLLWSAGIGTGLYLASQSKNKAAKTSAYAISILSAYAMWSRYPGKYGKQYFINKKLKIN